jgi:glutamyl-tRNA synthetase
MIRTRFAPSPTGYLHIGGARTALFNWLYARKTGGQFVLRIEDTDRERSTEASVQAILQSMEWLGMDYDEGPIYQTARFDRYREVIDQLVEQGDAYYCNCSRERIDKLRERQMQNKQKPRYDGCCRDKGLTVAADTVVRFRNPVEGSVIIDDQVKGRIEVSNQELDDLIIARSDGTPTYNLTVVVDDLDMQISDVIRGDDHVNNTPRQINIMRALRGTVPRFAHVPMILGEDGKRLSKRHGAVSVMQYHDDGYLPDALLNYLVRLGWSHGDQELFSRVEMTQHFSLAAINRAAGTFNPEKLDWVNQQYLKSTPLDKIVGLVTDRLAAEGITLDQAHDISPIVELYRERSKTLKDLVASIGYFFRDFDEFDPKAARKNLKIAAIEPLSLLRDRLAELEPWAAPDIHAAVHQVTEALQVGMGKVGQPLRVAVTGGSFSPPIDQTVEFIGREKTLKRISQAIDFIQQNNPPNASPNAQ